METVTIKGMSMLGYMADLLGRNDANKIELDRCREANKTLRQMNNQWSPTNSSTGEMRT